MTATATQNGVGTYTLESCARQVSLQNLFVSIGLGDDCKTYVQPCKVFTARNFDSSRIWLIDSQKACRAPCLNRF